jgi:phosphomannomutase
MEYIGKLKLPCKTGNFIELRNGMINISPIGRSCLQQERDEFEIYDKKHKIREKMINVLKEKFELFNLQFSIGGQISMDVFIRGWDKTYCLRFLKDYEKIYFYGDKTEKGGNDYEIFVHPRVIAKKVGCPSDTMKYINSFL